jgi:hypothetical protein
MLPERRFVPVATTDCRDVIIIGIIALLRICILLFEQQPARFVARATQTQQGEGAMQFLAQETKGQLTCVQSLTHHRLCLSSFGNLLPDTVVSFSLWSICAFIPDHHGTSSLLSCWQHSLKVAILQGMIGSWDRQPLHTAVQARSFGNGPGSHHPIDFQPEIIVQGSGLVFLHHKDERLMLHLLCHSFLLNV